MYPTQSHSLLSFQMPDSWPTSHGPLKLKGFTSQSLYSLLKEWLIFSLKNYQIFIGIIRNVFPYLGIFLH